MKRVKRALAIVVACTALSVGGPAGAAEPGHSLVSRLAGHTLNAVTFVPRQSGSSGGMLSRIVVQAYLGPDGRAAVRAWDANRNSYTPLVERRWSLSGATLCLDMPAGGPSQICADVHVWGPRIAGIGTRPYVMLDGDLAPGNTITGR